MDTARYAMALFVLLSIPTAFVLWASIHSFAAFWRKIGFFRTYGILSIPAGGVMTGIFVVRDLLLRIDFGTNPVTIFLGAVSVIGAVMISVQCQKYLSLSTLVGFPELSPQKYPGNLLTEGIYAKIRHPRYMGIALWLFGCVLFANHLMSYVFFVIGIPSMYVLVFLEEHELRTRFGAQYEAYCRCVPRFVPRSANSRPSC